MNKTVTINISGIIFHIEEDAYDKLSKYLNTIKGYFTSKESGNEIVADIEARVAELLQTKVNAFKQVVLMSDVDDVINALGKPEEFGIEGEEKTASQEQSNQTYSEPIKKRMFRDPDEKAIGGVCSGVAHYFDVDVVWIRLATFLLIFFGGVSLWVYIILWIVIPEAKTTADRLAMKGERVNIDNISRSFKDEMDGVKNRMNDGFKNASSLTRTGIDRLGDAIGGIFKIIGRLIGAFLIFIAVVIMFGLMSTIFGFSFAGDSAEFNDWIDIVFLDRSHYWLGFIGIVITIGVPAFMLLYGGFKMLFKIKFSNRWLNISAGLVWFVGFIMATYAGVKTASDFSESSKFKESTNIPTSSESFTISAVTGNHLLSLYKIDNFGFDDDSDHHFDHSDYTIGTLENKKVIVGTPKLRIVSSASDKIEVIINKKARGKEKRIAYNRAKEIRYLYQADSTKLNLFALFYSNGDQKFRVQEIDILVKVPKGKTIYLDNSLKRIINDVDNVTNTYDQDMLGRRWKMTDRGLECVDCDGIDMNSEDDDDKHVMINRDGIQVKEKDGTKITIDEKGIVIKNKNNDDEEIKDKK